MPVFFKENTMQHVTLSLLRHVAHLEFKSQMTVERPPVIFMQWWPAWFPYPSSWLKALGLAFPTWAGAVAFLSLEVWHFVFLFTRSTAIGSSSPPYFLRVAAMFLVASLIWYSLLVFLYSLLLRFLWREVPKSLKWLSSPKGWKSILCGWAITTLAVLVGAVPFLVFGFQSSDFILETMHKRLGIEAEQALEKMFVGWYVTAAYLYQALSVFKQQKQRIEHR